MDAGQDLPPPDASCDGGDLDCGSGLLLIIRAAMQPLAAGRCLLVKSRERSVREDLPAWCRMVGHELLAETEAAGGYRHYLLRKKQADQQLDRDLQQAKNHTWQVRLRKGAGLAGKATMRNHALMVGQPASFDVQDEAPSAIEYLLLACGGALQAGLAWRLSQQGIEVPNLEVVVRGRLQNALYFLGVDDSGSPALAAVEVTVYTDADCSAERLNELFAETLRRCPVTQSITRFVPLQTAVRTL